MLEALLSSPVRSIWERLLWSCAVLCSFGIFGLMVQRSIEQANENVLATAIETVPIQVVVNVLLQ